MKLFVFVSFLVAASVARPDVSHLLNQPSNAYLPSRSGFDDGGSIFITPKAPLPTVLVSNQPTSTPFFGSTGQSSIYTAGVSSQPTITTFVPKIIRPSSSTQRPETIAVTSPTATTNYIVSTQQTSVPAVRIDGGQYQQGSGIAGQYFQSSSSTPSSISISTSASQPSSTVHSISAPQQTQITETRFSGSNIPTGSYLPTSGVINTIFQGSQSGFGDGSFLTVPGLESVQQIGGQSQKSVYFYAAPDEEESQSRLRINILPSSQSSTRVIFIKAPSYAAPIPEVYSAPSETSDKTLIYVLSKRPDAGSAISIPASTIIKPTKPEIFFIKYGSQQEAQQAISSGLSGQLVGENIVDLLNEKTFIDAIKDAGSNVGSSVVIKGPVSTTTSQGISVGSGSVSVTTAKPTKVTKFGPAGDSGPY